jgi:arabinosyltransferase
MVTWANFHYLSFVENWVSHVRAAGVTAYVVGAMDNELLEQLARRELNTFSMDSGLSRGDFGWGTEQFHKMVRGAPGGA